MAGLPLTLDDLNASTREQFTAQLNGIYEHSPWIAEVAWDMRPFASLAQLKRALVDVVRHAGRDAQLALLRAHPELAGKAMVANALTTESTHEQSTAGLAHCSPGEFATLQSLNRAYREKFDFPFMLAVRGPRGTGLTRAQIIETFIRRLANAADFELAEAMRNVHRIAELRLADRFGDEPLDGNQAWDWAEQLAEHTDAEGGQLTVTYLTDAHRAVAAQLEAWMRECGFDRVHADAVGNVIGVYDGIDADAGARARAGDAPDVPFLMTGSHYDTVRNAGKYDGRLGIFAPMLVVRRLMREGRRLPFGIEVVGFAEEEGQRFKATFLGSAALTGGFDAGWLTQVDRDGVTMRDAMQRVGLPATMEAIARCARDPSKVLGFVEVHIEQGPVLNDLDLPLGVVTSINGSVRFTGEVLGTMSHAGTTPMKTRRDAATAVSELALFLEQRAAREPDLVGTMGMLNVPNGSVNVVPGRVQFTLDIRATTDASRDACAADVLAELQRICERRNLSFTIDESMRAAAAPSAPAWQSRWERAVASRGLPVHRMPSGAGHDAMKMHDALPQAMLFVRGLNGGISHNPLESSTADDMQLAIDAFDALVEQLAVETPKALAAMATSAGKIAAAWAAPSNQNADADASSAVAAASAPTSIASAERSAPSPARLAQRSGSAPTYARLDAWIDAHFDHEVAFLQALVQVPTDTPPGDNAPHAVRTAELLEGFGLVAEQHPVPDADVKAAGLQSITNLIVRRRYGIGPTIALNAHGDVVPPGDGWRHAPYGGEVVDGKLYGRASAVSKSDFATYTFALRALDALEMPLAGAVELHFTYDEEFGGELGPGRLLREGLTKPDLLIAAGFSYQVVTAHNGCLQMEVAVLGKQAHAAIPATGADALQAANAILNALYAQNEIYQSVNSRVEGITHPYLNVGRIEGGSHTNVVPGHVVLKLDRRMIPEEDPAEVEATIRRVIADAAASRPGIRVEIRRLLLARALQPLPGNAALVEALRHHGEAVFGEPIPTSGTPLYTDTRLYGEAGVPAAIYGAGPRTVLESNAKRADEHVLLADLRRATKVVARTLVDLLLPRGG